MLLPIVRAMVGKNQTTVQRRRLLRGIKFADHVVVVVRRDLLRVEVEGVAQQHAKLPIVPVVEEAVENGSGTGPGRTRCPRRYRGLLRAYDSHRSI